VSDPTGSQGQNTNTKLTILAAIVSGISLVIVVLVILLAVVLNNNSADDPDYSAITARDECISKSDNVDIPINKYVVEYYEVNLFNRVKKCTQVTENITINYRNDERNRILNQKLVAEYRGVVEYDELVTKRIDIQGDGETTIRINGESLAIIYNMNRNSSRSTTHVFEPGKHDVEIIHEYTFDNTRFDVRFEDFDPQADSFERPTEMSEALPAFDFGDTFDVHYISAYEAGSDGTIAVDISPTVGLITKPFILYLNSYEDIDWKVSGNKENLRGVIIASYNGSSSVEGIPPQAELYNLTRKQWSKLRLSYSLVPNCYPLIEGRTDVDCSPTNNKEGYQTLTKVFGNQNIYFSGSYNPTQLVTPGQLIDAQIIEEEYQKTFNEAKELGVI
jgi:hypothetical protein